MAGHAGNGAIKAAILAGHGAVGRRIVSVLARGGIDVLPAGSAEELEERLPRPDAIVLACTSTSANAKRLIVDLKRRFPLSPRIAVVRGGKRSRLVKAVLEANAEGVVYSERIGDALIPTLRAVSAGQVVVPQSEYRRTQPVVLSLREREVLKLAVEGMTNDAIARALYVSLSTVKSHLTSAFAKLSVRSRSEAAAVLLDPDEPVSRQIFGSRLEPEPDTELGAMAAAGNGR